MAPEWGIRALARTLITYQDKHGLTNVLGIIMRWAPPSENDTRAYADQVATAIGVTVRAPIDVHRHETMAPLVRAIIKHENGVQPYSGAQIDKGLLLAGVQREKPRPIAITKSVVGTSITAAGGALEAIPDLVPTITDAGQQLEPLAQYSTAIRVLSIVLIVAGVLLAIYGRISVRQRTGE